MGVETIWLALDLKTTLTLLCILLLSYLILSRRSRLPPRPSSVPVVGDLLWINRLKARGEHFSVALFEESKRLGDVIRINFGFKNSVFLHGYDTIHEVFVKQGHLFSDRPHWLPAVREGTKEGKGVMWQSGSDWRIMRKMTLHALKDFGVGKTSLEDKIFAEVEEAVDFLDDTAENPTDLRPLTSMMITNVIYGIVFGKRFGYGDKMLHQIIEKLDSLFHGGAAPTFTRHFPPRLTKLLYRKEYDRLQHRIESLRWIKTHIYTEIVDHESTFQSENIRDFIDLYLKAKGENSSNGVFTVGNAFRVIMDLFIAGSETTSNTINWCILYVLEYPDVQKKCQEEITQTCGERRILWSDRSKLPYVEATLLEIQRMANVASVSIPHVSDVDATIHDYFIPRRTMIQANLYSAHMDPRYWDKPHMFRPERFIHEGKLRKNEALIPFSIGPRACLGEWLAKMEMFVIFANLLQKFSFHREVVAEPHSFNCVIGQTTNAPLPYKTVSRRKI